jgi:hypothetical protein
VVAVEEVLQEVQVAKREAVQAVEVVQGIEVEKVKVQAVLAEVEHNGC